MLRRALPFVVFCVFAGAVSTQVLAAMDEVDEAGLAKFEDDFATAWNRHDVSALSSLWLDDADLVTPDGAAARGRSEVEALLSSEHAAGGRNSESFYDITDSAYHLVAPDVAVADWQVTVHNIILADNTRMTPSAQRVVLVLKRCDGAWFVAAARLSPCSKVEAHAATTNHESE